MASLTVRHQLSPKHEDEPIRNCRLCVNPLEVPFTVLESDGVEFLAFDDSCFDQLVRMVTEVRGMHASAPKRKKKRGTIDTNVIVH